MKLAAGYYLEEYKGSSFHVYKVKDQPYKVWIWFLDGKQETATDIHPSKKAAIEAAQYFIDHPEEYN